MTPITSSLSSEESKILFFDNNVIRPLLAGTFHLGDVQCDLRRAVEPPFEVWRTPFSMMELIGLNPKRFQKPDKFDISNVNGGCSIEAAYRHYESHFSSLPELTGGALRGLAEAQSNHVCSRVRELWEAMIAGFFGHSDEAEWLRIGLAFDAVHKIDILPAANAAFHSELIAHGFFKATRIVRNLSKFRLAYRLWLDTRAKLVGPSASDEQRTCIEEAHGHMRMGNWDDYLDCDLVHIAALGVEVNSGTRRKVTCVTLDKPSTVIARIQLYKGLLSYVRKLYNEAATAEGCPALTKRVTMVRFSALTRQVA